MMMWDDGQDALERYQRSEFPHWGNYLGFYSSSLNGYFREPWMMLIPADDHGFHRGDGVFEAVRIFGGAYFDLRAHLQRLENSATLIHMKLPKSLVEIEAICVRLAHLSRVEDGLLRLYVTRGPGGFSTHPGEVVGHQIYAVMTKMKPPQVELYESGASLMISTVPAKEPFWSGIKSCNYLQNVMMKRECVERGYDFAVCLNGAGYVCEGSTENLLLVTKGNHLLIPHFDYTLKGTTIRLVMKCAEKLIVERRLKSVGLADITRDDLLDAAEVAMVGTTLGVLPVVRIEESSIAMGKVGLICQLLHQSLVELMAQDMDLRTLF